jgi:hypothetical protein
MELMQASRQWASRPADERFTSLIDLLDHTATQKARSRAVVTSNRQLEAIVPDGDHKSLLVQGMNGVPYSPTHLAFGQLATLAGAPAGYLRTLPAPLAADALNYGLRYARSPDDVGLLLHKNGDSMLRAATGPRYGRIWNADIVRSMVNVFGDGITGDWRVPGEFGQDVVVTKANTTLYAGDRDMFVFLADERNRIEVPNRRDGKTGLMARGFFVWNSEVGSSTFGVSTFVFDYACANRIVWGADQVKEIKIRHTSSAPERFLEEIAPALNTYAQQSSSNILDGINKARAARIDDVDEFLANRYGKRMAPTLKAVHELEEGRPIETLWDVATAVTARARSIQWQDERVEIERDAGRVLDMAR